MIEVVLTYVIDWSHCCDGIGLTAVIEMLPYGDQVVLTAAVKLFTAVLFSLL